MKIWKCLSINIIVLMMSMLSSNLIQANSSSFPNNSRNILPEWIMVEKEIGRAGVMKPGEVLFISLPRRDLKVSVKGIPILPGLALGGWTAFKQMDKENTMVMGDLVLTEQEIQPVLSQLLKQGIQVSALHNHLLKKHHV
jgi:hypothetical protein